MVTNAIPPAAAVRCRLARRCPDQRREHIIAVAAEVFARDGYGGTTMATIAAQLGGSKATLYKYFPSKERLFEAVMDHRCTAVLAPLRALRDDADDDLETLLARFGTRFLAKIYETAAHDIHRMVQSEGPRFPEIADAFFKSGPDAVIEHLRATLERFADRGAIVACDLALLAGQFLGMLRGDRHLRFATGQAGPPDADEIAYHAAFAARVVVRGLTPPPPAWQPPDDDGPAPR